MLLDFLKEKIDKLGSVKSLLLGFGLGVGVLLVLAFVFVLPNTFWRSDAYRQQKSDSEIEESSARLERHEARSYVVCKYASGPKTGQAEILSSVPQDLAAPLSAPCNDGTGSSGSTITFQGTERDFQTGPGPNNDLVRQKSLASDSRAVDVFYATNRGKLYYGADRIDYGSERTYSSSFGMATVRIPENHREGQTERPWRLAFFSIELKQAEKQEDHFVIRGVKELNEESFIETIKNMNRDSAFVFVHGYNNSFTDGMYRLAQIVWDGQLFDTIPVLFSWPSKGDTQDYFYDEGSAELSVDSFIDLLDILQSRAGVKTINVVAHSMGNRIVLNAIAAVAERLKSQKLAEVVFAAPDVDRDVFERLIKKCSTVARGMTLYASASDKALGLKGWLAAMPRAGDVTKDGPLVVGGIESIDMSVMGSDLFALNHSTYADSPVIEDLSRLILTSQHPPHRRTARIRPVPERVATPKFWRYSN